MLDRMHEKLLMFEGNGLHMGDECFVSLFHVSRFGFNLDYVLVSHRMGQGASVTVVILNVSINNCV